MTLSAVLAAGAASATARGGAPAVVALVAASTTTAALGTLGAAALVVAAVGGVGAAQVSIAPVAPVAAALLAAATTELAALVALALARTIASGADDSTLVQAAGVESGVVVASLDQVGLVGDRLVESKDLGGGFNNGGDRVATLDMGSRGADKVGQIGKFFGSSGGGVNGIGNNSSDEGGECQQGRYFDLHDGEGRE
jgi:hypothetical protein